MTLRLRCGKPFAPEPFRLLKQNRSTDALWLVEARGLEKSGAKGSDCERADETPDGHFRGTQLIRYDHAELLGRVAHREGRAEILERIKKTPESDENEHVSCLEDEPVRGLQLRLPMQERRLLSDAGAYRAGAQTVTGGIKFAFVALSWIAAKGAKRSVARRLIFSFSTPPKMN